jgi:hypothetical protein
MWLFGGPVNTELDQVASELNLSAPESRKLAMSFGLACANRVEHLLDEPAALDCLQILERYVAGSATEESLAEAAKAAARLANQHQGSRSIDGCGHAAVSATYGVSMAVAGKAVEAAQYCAYAAVYAAGGYAAVAERGAFASEFEWQVQRLKALAAVAEVGSTRARAHSDA